MISISNKKVETMNTFLKIILVLLLIPITLIALALIVGSYSIVQVAKEKQELEQKIINKETNNIVEFFIDMNGKMVPLQTFFDHPPESMIDNPNDDAITRVAKKTSRNNYTKTLGGRKMYFQFTLEESYLSSVSDKDADGFRTVNLTIPKISAYTYNGKTCLVDLPSIDVYLLDDRVSNTLEITSDLENNRFLIQFKRLTDNDIKDIFPIGNKIQVYCKLNGYCGEITTSRYTSLLVINMGKIVNVTNIKSMKD